MLMLRLTILLLILSSFSPLWATDRYVDATCAAGAAYDPATRTQGSGSSISYQTIQAAINAMSGGDDIYMRGGTYQPTTSSNQLITIPLATSGTSGNWSSLQSYPGEWAIIDGQNNCGNYGTGIGYYLTGGDWTTASDVSYWLFERFELKNVRSSSGSYSWGIFLNGGPNKFRYLYIHDCVATDGGNIPFGLGGYHWQNNIVEYCYLNNVGYSGEDGGWNASSIGYFSDYMVEYQRVNGFVLDYSEQRPGYKNIIRYNYIVGGAMGFSHKEQQLFSGRQTGFTETYNDYGDQIHHNIFYNCGNSAIMIDQDFAQAYNNVIDTCKYGIYVGYDPTQRQHPYKVGLWNNTLMNCSDNGILRFNRDNAEAYNPAYYQGYDWNNIIDASGHVVHFSFSPGDITVAPVQSFDLSGYYGSNNYSYRPNETDVYRLRNTAYTQSQYEAQTLTGTPRQSYTNAYDAGNLLYAGTSGANKYIPASSGSHVIEGSTTIANGGIGGSHPYLSGVTIPSYVGAVNPSDSDWVAQVLDFDAAYFTAVTGGSIPTWLDDGVATSSTSGVRNGALRNATLNP